MPPRATHNAPVRSSLFRLPLHFLHAPRMRHRAHVPNIIENFARRRLEDTRQLAVMFPRPRHGFFVDRALARSESRSFCRNVRLRKIEPHVALALLFGVVKRMRVQVGPHELPADILEPKFEMCVLINGVVPAEIRARTNRHALLFRDLIGTDQPRRIARARRSHRRIEWMVKRIAERHARSRCFNRRSRGTLRISWCGRQSRVHLHHIVHPAPNSPGEEQTPRKIVRVCNNDPSSLTQFIRLTRNN